MSMSLLPSGPQLGLFLVFKDTKDCIPQLLCAGFKPVTSSVYFLILLNFPWNFSFLFIQGSQVLFTTLNDFSDLFQ